MPKSDAPLAPGAVELLSSLLKAGFQPGRIDELHDFLKLLGVVVGQVTLLTVATSPFAEAAPRVSAAKALLDIKETPESFSERLRQSQFSGLSMPQLTEMIGRIREGETDVAALLMPPLRPPADPATIESIRDGT